MNLTKIYFVAFLVLLVCSLESNGFLLGLLLRIIALKGALFIGTPIALGSFVIGQGVGFLAGKVVGGYVMLKAAQRFHEHERTKWAGSSYTSGYSSPLKSYGHGLKLTTKYPYDHTYYLGKPEAHTVSYGYGGYETGYGKGHSIVTHDTGYHPVKSIDHYGKGYHKGLILGSGLKGFKAGLKEPAHFSGGYGYGHFDHTTSHPYTAYGHGPRGYGGYETYSHPSRNIGHRPSYFNRFTSIFRGKKPISNYGPPKLHQPAVYHEGHSQHQSYGLQSTAHEVYDGPGKQYTGIISSDPSDHTDSDGSTIVGDSGQVSVLSDPEYTVTHGSGISTNTVLKSYNGHDNPKSEAMGLEYFNNDYESQPSIGTDDLVQAFGTSSFPEQPNAYGDGKPLGEPMSSNEYGGYSYSTHNHKAEYEPLDQQASIAYHVSSEAMQVPVKKIGKGHEGYATTTSASNVKLMSVPAPNSILEKYLEEKLERKAQESIGEKEKKEARHIIELLRKAYVQQLMDSLNMGKPQNERREDIPDFKPLPHIPNTTSAAPSSSSENYTSLENGSRPKRQSLHDSSIETQSPTTIQDSPSIDKEAQEKFVKTFVDDVKNFFVLVSALDQDTCLQKLVCDVHTRTDQPDLTTYESNIISTFRIMDSLMPSEVEDSSSIYRRAARIGEIGGSAEICEKSYASCGYTASQIITLGAQVESADSSNLNPMMYSESDPEYTGTIMPRV